MPAAEECAHHQTSRRRFRGPLLLLLLTGATVLLALLTKSLLPGPDPSADGDDPPGQLSDALAALVDESQPQGRRMLAASRVARFGDGAIPELRKLLESNSESKRRIAIITLGQMYSAAAPALDDLLSLVDLNSPEAAVVLLHSLIRIAPDDERVKDFFRKAVAADSVEIRDIAYEELASHVSSEGSVLVELLRSDDAAVRLRAISALPEFRRQLDSDGAESQGILNVASILNTLLFHDESTEVRIAAFNWLYATGRLTDANRLRVLNGPDLELYSRCMHISGDSPDANAIRARLLELLGEKAISVSLRETAMQRLALDGYVNDRALPASMRLIFEEGLPYYDENWPGSVSYLAPFPDRAWKMSLDEQFQKLQRPESQHPVLYLHGQGLTTGDIQRVAALSHLKVLGFSKCNFEKGFPQQLSSLTDLQVLAFFTVN